VENELAGFNILMQVPMAPDALPEQLQ